MLRASASMFLAAVLSATAFTGALGSVSDVTLRGLADASEAIILGTVTEIRMVEGVRVARIEIEEVLKGMPPREAWFLAQSTWTCDVTGGDAGERMLLFLTPYTFRPPAAAPPAGPPGVIIVGVFQEPAGFRRAILELTGGETFWAVSWSGRGQMIISGGEGAEHADVWTKEVHLPGILATAARQSEYGRDIPLPLLQNEILMHVLDPELNRGADLEEQFASIEDAASLADLEAAEQILVQASAPGSILQGETLMLTLTIANLHETRLLYVVAIELEESLMRGFKLLDLDPAPQTWSDLVGDLSLEYAAKIQPGDRWAFEIELEAVEPGTYSGEIVVEDGYSFLTRSLQIQVNSLDGFTPAP